ncbi:hypothetical protein RhiirA5_426860 [Rhizophagus irregularis]|uniref:Uncharacterized protein n=3 Tax=Rhizophagus irregularis TaxID=588596 RepID=U9TDZ0_RHIID|nr:hypothetical protein GLOIN_2v1780263 [Rhizophagus irregularis DAOM 181602=DAOM 197198]EXX68807.1 hypothetical protein RirG_101740 [Rhizophagus irregularis DAOM 197198w]PKC01348.1 hypothetical protein RhiirA5_426860 [Rhizophagus irregularis]PKC60218.1 hypothetical protein RhiirA1_468349 [Rhizophagus irregularis]PKY24126.1 hypothetical protein RhiirB3_438565 [Rhizophagus irregularis]POG66733.1 hypothetical protein GLOIN_2v1780263 [Rhizophagus irregularis DAOM 181602=DAOM 197198]|eukprot:XP_025173599.1 hypothetical protein GLOIN_2v1780263 [Rhizophagus irregularis DAOM 181602=DAOM 197198]
MSTSSAINPVATVIQRRLLIKGRFFHSIPTDKKFFLITYKLIQENSGFSNDDDSDYHLKYDHEFIYSFNTVNYYVSCKLLSHSTVEDLLNNEKFDVNMRNNEIPLSPQQKLSLEESLLVKLYLRLSQGADEIII